MEDTPAPPPPPRQERTPRAPLVGPLFAWDLVRLARRGQDARSRTILACTLLCTLVGFTTIWFRTTDLPALFFGKNHFTDVKESARFAEQFMLAMLLAQMAVLVFLTPAYAAGSIADEKERRTWPFLLATPLTDREIVLGKFLARMTFLGGILAAGLPVLALTALVGGIDPFFLVFSYLFTGTTVLMIAAGAMASAVYASTFRGAMFRSYGMTVLYTAFGCGLHPLLSPFAVLVMLFYRVADRPQFVTYGGLYMACQLGITAFALNLALKRLRKVERRAPEKPRVKPRFDVPRPVDLAEDRDRFGDDGRDRQPMHVSEYDGEERPTVFEDDPFLWKEQYTLGVRRTIDDESIQSLKVMAGILMGCMLLLVVFVTVLGNVQSGRSSGTSMKVLMVFGLLGIAGYLMMMAPGVCGCVLREIQHKTLESLLTIPVPRRAILGAKWRTGLSRGVWAFLPGFVCAVFGFLASPLPLLAFPAAAYFGALLVFAVSLGLWLSCRVATVVRGVMIHMSVTVPLALVPFVITWQFTPAGLSLAMVLCGIAAVLVAGAALSFWRLTVRDFEKYGRT
jgi:ABC-type transport system involved in multi-copper enzyme maturation permease subunit